MKKTTKIILLMTLVCALIVCGMMSVSALDAKGKCGDDATYTYDKTTGELIISGKGAMYDYDSDDSPFYDSDIKSVTVKKGITRVGTFAFNSCDKLKKATITDTVKTIAESAFADCKNLESLKLPKKLEKIGYGVFKNCSKLKTVTLPDTLKSIGGSAFSGCTAIKSIVIPDSVTTINSSAFNYCRGLEVVEIGKNVKSIGLDTFGGCANLTEIIVDAKNENYVIEEGALLDNDKTKIIKYPAKSTRTTFTMPNSVTSTAEGAFADSVNLVNITLSENLKKIGLDSFNGCNSLKYITIPEKVSVIHIGTFDDCSSLEEINVAKNNKKYSSVNGVLYNEDKTTLIKYPEGKQINAYVVPVTVTKIENSAFYDAKLEKVLFEETLVIIGENAFESCDYLRSVTVPGSVKEVGSAAFMECSNLKKVTIKPGVEYIYSYAFSGCKNLTELELGAGIACIEENAFKGCSKLTKITFNGIKSQWDEMIIESDNDCLTNASVKFADNCSCHKSGLMGAIYKMQLFFWRLFKLNEKCVCGATHY